MKTIRIGDLAKESGVKVVTIRYYEQIGLMPTARRTSGNYRSYDPAARQRLQFIRRCRDLGFPLDQVHELLRLSSDRGMPCAEVKRLAAQQRRAIAAKLKDLRHLLEELRSLTTCCHGKCAIADCQIIEALSTATPKRRRTGARHNGRTASR